MACEKMYKLVLFSISICCFIDSASFELLYQWPLGDTSMLSDVIQGNDLSAAGNDQCFVLGESFKGLDSGSILLSKDATEYVEVNLSSKEPFKDLTISILVKPDGEIGGTFFHYAKDEIEKFRLRFLSTTAVVSFRDEFDNPAGLIPIPDLLDNGWNHLVVQRMYLTGEIRVYNNGHEKVKMDEGFPDNITVPNGGVLTVGNAPNEDGQQFSGNIACLQIYTDVINKEEIHESWEKCLSRHWTIQPSVVLEKAPDDPNKHCLANPPVLPETEDDVIALSVLTNEALWVKTKQRYKWKDSKRTFAYFSMISIDKRPSSLTGPIGHVNTSTTQVCSRLCMRIERCQSFATDAIANNRQQCYLYSSVSEFLTGDTGSKYYGIRN